jgi:hypothetical protein
MRYLFVAAILLASGAASAQTAVNGLSPSFGWTAASGSPALYEVWVKRSPATVYTREQDVTGLQVTLVAGIAGQVVQVSVQACALAKEYCGPMSLASDPVKLMPPIGTPGKPTWYQILVQWLRARGWKA